MEFSEQTFPLAASMKVRLPGKMIKEQRFSFPYGLEGSRRQDISAGKTKRLSAWMRSLHLWLLNLISMIKKSSSAIAVFGNSKSEMKKMQIERKEGRMPK